MTRATLAVMAGAVVCATTGFVSAGQETPANPHVPYPNNFRTWAVARTMLVGPQSASFANRGGFHHYYANDKAMQGYRTGKFPDGSIIVDEGVMTTERNGNTIETGRRSLDVMHKDSKTYAATGGWGYDHFEGDKQASEAPDAVRNECFKCHSSKKDTDSVFSVFRE